MIRGKSMEITKPELDLAKDKAQTKADKGRLHLHTSLPSFNKPWTLEACFALFAQRGKLEAVLQLRRNCKPPIICGID